MRSIVSQPTSTSAKRCPASPRRRPRPQTLAPPITVTTSCRRCLTPERTESSWGPTHRRPFTRRLSSKPATLTTARTQTTRRGWTVTLLSCPLPETLARRAWTQKWSFGTALPTQRLKSLLGTPRTGAVGRARTLHPSPPGHLRTLGEAARTPAWCEGGGGGWWWWRCCWWRLSAPRATGAWNLRPCCSEWRSDSGPGRPATHCKLWVTHTHTNKRTFPLDSPPVLMFPSADDVWPCLPAVCV